MVKYIFLGLIQGLTEFFPVSSSAHLVIVQKLLGLRGEELALPVVLHLGTVLALLTFFFRDIIKLLRNPRMCGLVLVVTFITGTIGILGKDFFESLFTSLKPAAFSLIITGIILLFTKKFMAGPRNKLTLKDAVILGFSQSIAIIPGISRSGITISTLLFRKINKETAFSFSFLISIPVIFGAALLEARQINFALKSNLVNFVIGFIFSFLAGIFALWVLKIVLNKAKLYYFGFYCIIVAVLTLLFIK